MPVLTQYDQQSGVGPALTPANAQGANFTPAVGQAMQRLGGELDQTAGTVARINYMSTEQDALAHASQIAGDGRVQFAKYAQQLQGEVPATGDGYTEKLHEAIKNWGNDAVAQMPTPRTKKVMQEHVASIWSDFGQHAVNWQYQQQQAYREGEISDGISAAAAAVQMDPTQYEGALRDQLSTINALHSDLTPLSAANKLRYSEKAKAELAYAASIKTVRDNPQESFAVLTGERPLPDASIQGKIAAAARAGGVDPNVALAISSYETGGKFDPTIRPIGKDGKLLSSAKGLFQKLGTTSDNPDDQIADGIPFIAANNKALQTTLGRAPSPGEQYAAHLLGIGGAKALLKAPNNMPFSQLVGQYTAPPVEAGPQAMMQAARTAYDTVSNNGLIGMTVGQVKQHLEQGMSKNMAATAGYANAPATTQEASTDKMPSYFAALTPQQREQMINMAERGMREKDNTQKLAVENTIKNHEEAFSHGISPGQLLAPADFAVFGKEGIYKFQQYQDAQNYGNQVAQVSTLPTPQIPQFVEGMRPNANSTAQQWHNYDMMTERVIPHMMELRKQQPLDYAATSGGFHVEPLDFTDPAKLAEQIKVRAPLASMVSQQYGTPLTMLMGNEKSQLTKFFSDATSPQIASMLQGLHAAPDPQSYMATLSQIAPDVPVIAGVGAIMDKQNPIQMPGRHFWNTSSPMAKEDVGATMLDGWRALTPPKGEGKPKGLPVPKENDMAQEFAKVVGNTFGTDAQSYETALQMARAYYVGSAMKDGSLNEVLDTKAMDKAITAATGGIVNYNSRGSIALPWGMKESAFNDVVATKFPKTIAAAGLDPKDYPIGAYGLTNARDGVYMVTSGSAPLRGPDGKILYINFNESDPVTAPTLDQATVNRGAKTFMPTIRAGR